MSDAATPKQRSTDIHGTTGASRIAAGRRDSDGIAREAYERTMAMLGPGEAQDETYYTFADKTILPTFLTTPASRKSADTQQDFRTVRGERIRMFPAFGASMSFMRAKFARDVYAAAGSQGGTGGVHILPRVGFTEQERLADVDGAGDAAVGMALGIGESDTFLRELLMRENLAFMSIDIAHGANAAALPVLLQLRELGVSEGVMLGNVGSVEGFLYAYWLLELCGFESPIVKVGVGPGSVCTTRINTGVGVGQFTLLQRIAEARAQHGLERVQILSDGGVNSAGEFVKAIAFADGVMMGKFFASGSFEDEVLLYESGRLTGIELFGMASAMVTEKRNYIEGSSQTLRSFHRNAGEAVGRLREGLQSAMTYVNALDLATFRGEVRFVTNSAAAIREGGVH